MWDAYTILVIVHVIGTSIGVGGATLIEVFLNISFADGKMEDIEKGFMKALYRFVRVGMVLALISGIGFLVYYWLNGYTTQLMNQVLWAKILIVFIIIINAVLLQYRKISLWWGSAFSFVSWYSALFLGVFLTQGVRYSFFEVMIYYGISVVIGGIILDSIRKKIMKKPPLPPSAPPPVSSSNAV